MNESRTHIYLLILFISCIIMNGFSNIDPFSYIGKYGKVVVSITGILILQRTPLQIGHFLRRNIWLILFWVCSVLFLFIRTLHEGFNVDLFVYTFSFMIYLYFLNLLFTEFNSRHQHPEHIFFYYLSWIFIVHFVLWMLIALGLGLSLWHTLEGRSGLGLFYENYIHLGFFTSTAAVANFGLYKFKYSKNRNFHLLMIVFFAVLTVLTNARNPQLFLGTVLILNVLPVLKRTAIKYLYIVFAVLFVVLIFFVSPDILIDDEVASFTTGRSTIWYYVYDYYTQTPIYMGEGIFGLNDSILQSNSTHNYYLQKIDFLYFHSSYIEIFSASGVIGFICFMIYIIKTLKRKKNFFIVTIIIGGLLGALVESYLVQPTLMVSFLIWYLIVGDPEMVTNKKFLAGYKEVNTGLTQGFKSMS